MNKTIQILAICIASTAAAAYAETVLYSGGQWDFETGFYATPHMLAGTNAPCCATASCGDSLLCPVPPDKKALGVGHGWTHWAAFPTTAEHDYWGVASFNENQNQANVYRGVRSQEITMTSANGTGLIYRQAAVPAGHRIRVKAMMKFTPNEPQLLPVQHSLGLDPTGGTNPTAPTVQWFDWDEQTPSPPQPAGVFNQTSETIDCLGSTLTIFIRMVARHAGSLGQTFLIDDVEVFDVQPLGPILDVSPSVLTPSARQGSDAATGALTIRNLGSGTLNYTITDNADWLTTNPSSGSVTTETDTININYDTDTMSAATYHAAITVASTGATNAPQVINVTLTVTNKPADLDGDSDVDQEDFGRFQACFTGPGIVAPAPRCDEADLDSDRDVDQDDFGWFQQCMSGSGIVSNPDCLN